ncbi:MarR family winged helix-turn-helix transcriptional regulator [Geochorda subterranea]|uniref:MarR family transcriptional regulator n=1 Tax=Geochorda subterranea TaxID=3109564 RepID=A0ABZ1BTZ8_9FIRM|nr:MarR family transcriptional regulator [Limnochorda sp. LNt]WRP15592.1 MarR family transcriptional regulator [Limnochorda sp. LNt]
MIAEAEVEVDRVTLGCRLDRALTALCRRLSQQAARAGMGLTPAQLFVLRALRGPHPVRVTDLAERLGIGASAVTLLLNRLEGMGLVARQRDTGDRRVVRVGLTPAGRDVLAQVEAERTRLVERHLARLSDAQAVAVVEALERLAQEEPGGEEADLVPS